MIRRALHAGTWYCGDLDELETQLEAWRVESRGKPPKALLVPHAGYEYSGQVAAAAFSLASGHPYKRIVLLGPSHRGPCGVCTANSLETPLGPLPVDPLAQQPGLGRISITDDEAEHSLEMQFPMIKHYFGTIPCLPILVSRPSDAKLIELLKPFLEDSLLVISSDFCHWGKRFGYVPELHELPGASLSARIRSLDMKAFEVFNSGSLVAFDQYLEETGNTICGRMPMRLAMLLGFPPGSWELLLYKQSGPIRDAERDSQVSYVAAVLN